MTAFEFSTAQRIKFGAGGVRQLGVLTRGLGQRVALVTGSTSFEAGGRLAEIEAQFRESELTWLQVKVTGEPTVELIDRLTAGLEAFNPEVVVGIGGGSVLDTAKALAALLANGGSALDYLEGVGRGATLSKPSLPCVAVPTTAGTGSEATRNAVIGDEAHTFKKSMRSATMLPSLALVDPDLTASCPREVVALCGMDAITQLIEAYTSPRSGPITDSLALAGIGYAAELPFLLANPDDPDARESVALASLMSGMCLANAGLGAVHGLASPLGAFFSISHGAACAALLPHVLRMNIARAMQQDQAGLIYKYSAIYEILAGFTNIEMDDEPHGEDDDADELLGAGGPGAEDWESSTDELLQSATGDEVASEEQVELTLATDNAMQLVAFIQDMRHSLKLPRLRDFGIHESDFQHIVAESGGTSMQTNPVKLGKDDLMQILQEAL